MKKYLKQLYFGCYYFDWMQTKAIHKILDPLLRFIMVIISKCCHSENKHPLKNGMTQEEHIDAVLKYNYKFDSRNVGHIMEQTIGLVFYVFFVFVLTDIFLLLRYIFGYNWFGVYMGRCNVVPIGMTIIVLATILMFAFCGNVGTEENEREFRRLPKNKQHASLIVFLGSCVFVSALFFLLWGYKIFG